MKAKQKMPVVGQTKTGIKQHNPKNRGIMSDPIIANEALPVNEESSISGFPDTDTIQRCPQDEGYRFSVVSNALIRDVSISPECRWLVIYLLSNKEGWKINVQQVINHLKPHMGRDKVHALFNEGINAGYIKREDYARKNPNGGTLKGFRYIVSESPKFKKVIQHTENQDTGDQGPGFPHIKKDYSSKKDYPKESNSSLKVPELPKQANGDNAAKAAEMEVKPSPKPKREKPDFSPKVREVGNQMINSLTRTKPDYLPSKNLSAFLTEVDFLLRLDKREADKTMDVFNWALSDSFWADKMFKPNPAKYLREKFDQLEMKMLAKPEQPKRERKFAPSSDQNAALECMEDMKKRAL